LPKPWSPIFFRDRLIASIVAGREEIFLSSFLSRCSYRVGCATIMARATGFFPSMGIKQRFVCPWRRSSRTAIPSPFSPLLYTADGRSIDVVFFFLFFCIWRYGKFLLRELSLFPRSLFHFSGQIEAANVREPLLSPPLR